MTNKELDKNRLEIIKNFLSLGEILHLEDLDIAISSSNDGIYHVFFDPTTKHQYSINDLKLEEIAKTLKIDAIKKIYIEERLLKRQKKLENIYQINPLDFEGYI